MYLKVCKFSHCFSYRNLCQDIFLEKSGYPSTEGVHEIKSVNGLCVLLLKRAPIHPPEHEEATESSAGITPYPNRAQNNLLKSRMGPRRENLAIFCTELDLPYLLAGSGRRRSRRGLPRRMALALHCRHAEWQACRSLLLLRVARHHQLQNQC